MTYFPLWKTRFKDVKFAALKLGEQNPSAGADVVSVLRALYEGLALQFLLTFGLDEVNGN